MTRYDETATRRVRDRQGAICRLAVLYYSVPKESLRRRRIQTRLRPESVTSMATQAFFVLGIVLCLSNVAFVVDLMDVQDRDWGGRTEGWLEARLAASCRHECSRQPQSASHHAISYCAHLGPSTCSPSFACSSLICPTPKRRPISLERHDPTGRQRRAQPHVSDLCRRLRPT